MKKPKKDCIQLHIKADAAIMRRFSAYCEEMGQTKTKAFERIVTMYLDERGFKTESK